MSNKKTSYSSSISKTSDGKYRVNFSYISPDTYERKRTSKRGFEKKKDAEAWIKSDLQALIKQLEHKETLDENLTMAELVEIYMNDARIRKEETTCLTKEHIIKTKILPYFESKKVYDICARDVRNWQNTMMTEIGKNGKPYSPTYLRSISNQLSSILNYAVTFHNLPFNPVLRVERMGTKNPEEEQPIWTLEEYQRFSEAMQDKPIFFYAFEVLYWSGLRLGELLGLTKDDISIEEGTLKVARSYKTQVHKDGKTKTVTSKRTVHIPQNLVDELAEYMETLYGLSGTDKLFPISKTSLHKRLKEGSEQAGLEKITIHGFRHSHISMIMNDIQCASVMDVAKRAGHKKPSTTMIYTHRYKSKDEIIANELNKLMMGERGNVSEE